MAQKSALMVKNAFLREKVGRERVKKTSQPCLHAHSSSEFESA